METNYDVDYFIRKFEAIPESLWTVNTRHENGKRCALGWCYVTSAEAEASMLPPYVDNEEDKALCALVMFLHEYNSDIYGMGGINNGVYKSYQQSTPKQRVLAALQDIKLLQQPKYENITKQLAILPVEETTDKVGSVALLK
jgi:hypothetical protein